MDMTMTEVNGTVEGAKPTRMMMNPMRGSLHIDLPFTILFEEWNVTSTKDVLLSCLLLIILSFFNEGLKLARSHIDSVISGIISQENQPPKKEKTPSKMVIQYIDGCRCVEMERAVNQRQLLDSSSCIKRNLKIPKIPLHIINCLLYGLQMFISFGLMLTVMSFHTGVIASVVVGGIIGKVVFAWPGAKTAYNTEEEEGCH